MPQDSHALRAIRRWEKAIIYKDELGPIPFELELEEITERSIEPT
ncbi:MAG: hypothetical protein QXQ02_00635 [Halobacteria archaeon]